MSNVWTTAELKEEWREENWERKANGVARITWASFSLRKSVYMRAGALKTDPGTVSDTNSRRELS